MQVHSIITDATTGEEWIQLESCWSRVYVSAPAESFTTRQDRLAAASACVCRYLDGVGAEQAGALVAVRFDGQVLTCHWEEEAPDQLLKARIELLAAQLGHDCEVIHRSGLPFDTEHSLRARKLRPDPRSGTLAA